MDFVAQKADLVRELYLLQGIAERRNAIPSLSNVLLDVVDEGLDLAATDLDVSLRCRCSGQVNKPGSLTVSAKKLYEIIRALPEQNVHLKALPQDYLSVESGRAVFKIAGLKKEDFPVLPELSEAKTVRIDGAAMRDLVARTAFTATSEDARYFLSGALLLIEKDTVSLVATDGHRLSFARRASAATVSDAMRVLIPRKALHELGRLLEEAEAIEYHDANGHLVFAAGGRTLTSKMVEGQFPAFESVVALKGDKAVTLNRETFADSVRRVSLLSSERGRSVRLALRPGALALSASSAELGEAQETLSVDYTGDEVAIGFNAQYILDFLQSAGSDEIKIELKNADSQGIFQPVGQQTEHRYVVMPMRL